jgi:hypothetical protein
MVVQENAMDGKYRYLFGFVFETNTHQKCHFYIGKWVICFLFQILKNKNESSKESKNVEKIMRCYDFSMPSRSSKNDQIKKPTNPDLVAENIPISPKKFTRKLTIQVKVPQAAFFEIKLNST